MICNLTIGESVVELAGGLGRTSETSGLRIDVQPSFERVAYIGVNEARQYARPGASVSVSFDSSQTFATLALAEAYILGLPSDLIDQTGATAEIGQGVTVVQVTGTLTSDGVVPAVFPNLFDAGVLNETTVWTDNGTAIPAVAYCQWNSSTGRWEVIHGAAKWQSGTTTLVDTPTPDVATGWAAVSPATGTPTVDFGTSITPSLTIYDAEAIVSAAHQGATVRLSVNLTGRLTSP